MTAETADLRRRQRLQWADRRAQHFGGHVRAQRGGLQPPVAQQHLDHAAARAAAIQSRAFPASTDDAGATEPAAPVDVAAEAMDAAPERPRDETWIETARCPSRNDCQLNNDRKQAHIAEISTGCYRQLTEAAEGCTVAIIHCGRPRAPQEPGLGGLVRRRPP